MSSERIMAGLKLAVGVPEDEPYTFEEAIHSLAKEAGMQVMPAAGRSGMIYPALIEAMREVGAVAKLGEYRDNKGTNYRFRGVDAVVNACGPALRKAGILPVPVVENIERRPGTTQGGGSKLHVVAKVTYRFTAADGSHVDVTVEGEASDTSDKGTGKAMSVAYRIALLQLFAIPTDDPDPDAVRVEGGHAPPLSDALVAFILAGVRNDPVERLEGLWHLLTSHVQADTRLPHEEDQRVWWEVFADRYRAEVTAADDRPKLEALWKALGQFGRTFRVGRDGDVGQLITERNKEIQAAYRAALTECRDLIHTAVDSTALDLAVEVVRQHLAAHRILPEDSLMYLEEIDKRRKQLREQEAEQERNPTGELAAALAEEAANDRGDGEGVDY